MLIFHHCTKFGAKVLMDVEIMTQNNVDDVARCGKNERYLHVILYADDILLLAPSVTHFMNINSASGSCIL